MKKGDTEIGLSGKITSASTTLQNVNPEFGITQVLQESKLKGSEIIAQLYNKRVCLAPFEKLEAQHTISVPENDDLHCSNFGAKTSFS